MAFLKSILAVSFLSGTTCKCLERLNATKMLSSRIFFPANRRESSRVAGGGGGGAMGLGDMVRKELAGKHFLNFEPHGEKLRKRIISKKGHVNIGKVKVSKR